MIQNKLYDYLDVEEGQGKKNKSAGHGLSAASDSGSDLDKSEVQEQLKLMVTAALVRIAR